MYHHFSVFKNESKLDLNYIPTRLPHRKFQRTLLNQFFRFTVENPGEMTQRVLITGNVGTGKTVLSQHFGLDITKEAEKKEINLNYIHVNCRECRGSLFMILQRALLNFHPHFPKRGYSAEEILQILIQILDEQNAYLILAIDELETLIQIGGSDTLYKLTRVQEARLKAPQRLSLICILREPRYLNKLDSSTRSTLQRNIIRLDEYSTSQLQDILKDRVDLAFKHETVSTSTLHFIAELASSENGDARYGIELLWRAGKYADASELSEVSPECVRKAVASVYPLVQKDVVFSLSSHEKLFLLSLARCFKHSKAAYLSMGEAEQAYAVVCEEYNEKKRGHTQLWKYIKELSALGIIKTELSSFGQRGKTTYISLPRVPALDLEQELAKILSTENRRSNTHAD
ncbi:MAG: ORC1-type DNA replication protein [Candidatus Bathyarchaeota archaeon]|nr:MAG: ORC1-type DNA replication protein [Candidatus Bathyarchaeota archaeon]